MKKWISMLLVVFIVALCGISASAVGIVSVIRLTVTAPKIGEMPSDVVQTPDNSRYHVTDVRWNGELDSDGCFQPGQSYTVSVDVAINDDLDGTTFYAMTKGIKINDNPATFQYTNTQKTTGNLTYTFPAMVAQHEHCCCGGDVIAGNHTEHTKSAYRAWNGTSAISYTDNVAHVYLKKDASRTQVLNVPGSKKLYLCLNGHTIKMNGKDRVINISSGGQLVLCDCSEAKSGIVTGGTHSNGGGVHIGGTMYMYGGTITGNRGGYGGGVWNNYNFYLYGGAINKNEASSGGGVWNANSGNAEFVMYGGSINENNSGAGGGVWNNDNGNFVMKAGELVGNLATYGGGVWNQGATFVIDGGFVYENQANYGGGVWNQTTMVLNGGYVVANEAVRLTSDGDLGCGGGIWNNGNSLVRMLAGEISGNYAGDRGGGVWNNGTADFVMEGGLIAGNQAKSGGGVYIQYHEDDNAPGVFRMYEPAIVKGNGSVQDGGGFYVKGILENIGGYIGGNVSQNGVRDIFTDATGVVREHSSLPTVFVDVPADAYYLQSVLWGIENNIVSGTSDITFSPDESCNTAQVLTFLWRAYGSPEVEVLYELADVTKTDYFYMPAHWGKSLGLKFVNALYPNFSCSRISAIYYMWLAEGSPESDFKLPFTDIEEGTSSYKAVAWAMERGITNGTSPTTFSPSKTCTRAQILTFIWRNMANK